MLGKRKKLSPQEDAFRHKLSQKQQFIKAQERLNIINTYLTNMQTMLRDSAHVLQLESYPVDNLTWLVEKGFPVIQKRIQLEQQTLKKYMDHHRSTQGGPA